jgi:hypothetical protein
MPIYKPQKIKCLSKNQVNKISDISKIIFVISDISII